MRNILLSSFLAFGLVIVVAAAPGQGARVVSQEMIPLSSPLYEMMDALYQVAAIATPSNARPWSKTEANMILGRVDRASLGSAGISLYDKIAELAKPGLKLAFGDGFQFGAAVEANFEAYWHSNTGFDRESDWIYGFEQRKPMAKLSLDFSLDNFFYAYCDMQYGRNRFNIADELFWATDVYHDGIGAIILPTDTRALMAGWSSIYSQSFLTNILEKAVDFDFQWPKRAIASVGGAKWNLSFSRDKLSWGNGHSGNFIVDDHVDYQEFARLIAFSDLFKYDWLFVFFDMNPTVGEIADTKFKVLMAHRLEFRILKRLSFAISENVMYQNDVFDLRYINPAFIYHNLNNRSIFNAIAHAELDFAFAKGFNAYAQFVMDQGRAPTESAVQADAAGYLAGIEYARLVGPGILTSSLEFAKTDPLLYRREFVDFLMFRKYYTNGDPTGPGYILNLDYIGYEYGGDALVLQWDTGFRIPGVAALGLGLFGMRHGAMNFFVSHNKAGDNAGLADYEGSTPSGDVITDTLIATLRGEYEIPRLVSWAKAKVWAHFAWVNRRTYTKSTDTYSEWDSDVQLTAGCSLAF